MRRFLRVRSGRRARWVGAASGGSASIGLASIGLASIGLAPTWLASVGLAALALIGASAQPAQAQIPLFADEIERLDVVSLEQDGRDVFAFNSVTGSRARVRLEADEVVLFNESRGRVAVVLTNYRALAVGAGGNFQEARYRLAERAPEHAVVGERVALVATNRRALGFVGSLGGWIEESFTPAEDIEAIRAGAAVGVAATNRRILGLAPDVARFASLPLGVKESLESIEAEDTLAKLRTDRRILVFSGPRAVWTYRLRNLDR